MSEAPADPPAARPPRRLPVIAAPAPRARRPGRLRAWSLLLVHALVALHVAHWLEAGETLSPLEPSEASALSAHGVVTAGVVFFGLALLSTAVLGRWFCGWACHLVALQDLARAALLRLGLTPRPLRSRALALIPAALCVGMFVAPWALRALAGEDAGVRAVRLTTDDLWATFPGPWVAGATFVTCGALSVLLLGAKGFCTYACPYGAAFGLLDRLAPGRIRVSDACTGCGTCTAVCSSNVQVHAEVRDWGMVVDPGCMKCLDCVGSCPTGALSFGLGRPALLRRAASRSPARGRAAAFTLAEELSLAAAALGAFLAWRGLYEAVPVLLAATIAGLAASCWLLAWRIVRRQQVSLLRWRLCDPGRRPRPAGVALVVVAALLLGVTAHAAAVQLLGREARRLHAEALALRPDWPALLRAPARLSVAQRGALVAGVAREEALARWSLVPDPDAPLRRAWLHLLLGDHAACEASLRAAVAAREEAPEVLQALTALLVHRRRFQDALPVARRSVARSGDASSRRRLAQVLFALRRSDEAAEVLVALLALRPDDALLLHDLGTLREQQGDLQAACLAFARAVALRPELERPRLDLARAQARLRRAVTAPR